jgi:hypothetical protein
MNPLDRLALAFIGDQAIHRVGQARCIHPLLEAELIPYRPVV